MPLTGAPVNAWILGKPATIRGEGPYTYEWYFKLPRRACPLHVCITPRSDDFCCEVKRINHESTSYFPRLDDALFWARDEVVKARAACK